MKNQMKNQILLGIVLTMSILMSCGNSNVPVTENIVSEEPQIDEYAMLREPNQPTQKTEESLSGKVNLLTEKEFIERITELDNPKGFQYLGQTPCIVELYADWCRPCILLSNVLNELAPEYKDKVIFYKLNSDKAPRIVKAFNVVSIPKVLYFKPYGKISSTVGFLTREELRKMIDDLLLKP